MEVEKTRVLVVDDESVLAGVVANYLDRAGFATRLSGDGLEAVELVDEWAPAVVLLDLGLPGLDGIEVRYSYDKTTYKGTATPDEIEAVL